MKKVLALLLVASLSSCVMRDAKYRIESGKDIHYTSSYNTNEKGCITFQEDCGCGSEKKQTVTMCGTYTITELKQQY